MCKEKHVKIGYCNLLRPGGMFVSDKTGKMIKYALVPTLKGSTNVAYHWELEEMFFIKNNIKPEWIQFSTNDWGYLDETTGQWSGAVGLIQRDEADYAISEFSVSYARSKVVAFSPTSFKPLYWATIRRINSPIWNLFGLFTKVLSSSSHGPMTLMGLNTLRALFFGTTSNIFFNFVI